MGQRSSTGGQARRNAFTASPRPPTQLLSPSRFRALLAAALDVSIDDLVDEARLAEDLHLDAFSQFRLSLIVDTAGGAISHDAFNRSSYTVADLYHDYAVSAATRT